MSQKLSSKAINRVTRKLKHDSEARLTKRDKKIARHYVRECALRALLASLTGEH